MRYKQFPQFIGYQQMLFPSLLVITHRGQKKYLQGIIGLAGNFYHGGVSRPVLTNSRTSSFTQSFSNTSIGFALAQESILSIMVSLLADLPTDTPRKTAIRKSDSLWTRFRLLRYVNDVIPIIFLWEMQEKFIVVDISRLLSSRRHQPYLCDR